MQSLNGQTRDQGVTFGKARISRGPSATTFSAHSAQESHAAPEAPLQNAAPATTKRDPAPSRLAYRANRLWLTPGFRLTLRAGVPAVLTFAAVALYFGHDNNRQDFIDRVAEIRRSVEERPEFMVNLMSIDGASDELAADIREVLPLDFPLSSFDLDLVAMKNAIQGLGPVARADLRIKAGGILQVEITERTPAVVWRGPSEIELLDAYGNRVAGVASRTERSDLPLIAGEGAEANVAQALRLLATAAPIDHRIRGLVRIGERRWDVVLDNDQRILLPQENPVQALQQVIALDQAQELLSRDILAVDMRNIHRPTLRMAPMATEELRRIKDIELGASNQ